MWSVCKRTEIIPRQAPSFWKFTKSYSKKRKRKIKSFLLFQTIVLMHINNDPDHLKKLWNKASHSESHHNYIIWDFCLRLINVNLVQSKPFNLPMFHINHYFAKRFPVYSLKYTFALYLLCPKQPKVFFPIQQRKKMDTKIRSNNSLLFQLRN